MLDKRNDSTRYKFLSCAARKPVGEQTRRGPQANPVRSCHPLMQLMWHPPQCGSGFAFASAFGLILLPGSMLRLPRTPGVLPGEPLVRGFHRASQRPPRQLPSARYSRLKAASRPPQRPRQDPVHGSAMATSRPLRGKRGEALVYRLPRPHSNSTLPVETETPSYKHPKTERVRIRGQVRP